MFYIKLEKDMSLVITVRESIYRGDNLNQKIRYLIPLTVGDIDMLTAFVYLNYIRPDGVPEVVRLERLTEKYNEYYYQYTFPVTCKMTKCAGQVCTWMQILTGDPSKPTIAKTGECMLQIEESKNMDDYLADQQIAAIYRMEKQIEDCMNEIADMGSGKADGLSYDKESRALQLISGDVAIGDPVTVPSDDYVEDITGEIEDKVEDTWSDMTDTSDDQAGTEDWDSM